MAEVGNPPVSLSSCRMNQETVLTLTNILSNTQNCLGRKKEAARSMLVESRIRGRECVSAGSLGKLKLILGPLQMPNFSCWTKEDCISRRVMLVTLRRRDAFPHRTILMEKTTGNSVSVWPCAAKVVCCKHHRLSVSGSLRKMHAAVGDDDVHCFHRHLAIVPRVLKRAISLNI